MSQDGNQRKAAQLGMPFGTANGRLRKSIIFRLLQRLGEDICFQCGGRIESIDTLSIEHKQPWLDSDTNLFWDMDNIAFSHLSCNSKATRARRQEKSGKVWCSGHQDYLPPERFGRNCSPKAERPLRYYCNECRKGKGWER